MSTWFGGSDIRQGQEELAKAEGTIAPQMSQMGTISGQMEPYEQAWAGHRQAAEEQYQGLVQGMMNDARKQGQDARAVYTNTISPNLMSIMEGAKGEAANAMTLQQAQDPNNPVAQAFRQFYDKQAAGTQQAGMATAGTMQALGAQALAGQIGGGMPVTGGQLQALQAGYGAQAGQAMAQTQQQMERLRQQGLEQGWLQTQAAYDRGQGAKDRYRQGLGDIQGAQGQYLAGQQGLRGEMAGYGQGRLESKYRGGQAAYEAGMSPLMRKMGMVSQEGDIRRGIYGSRAQIEAGEAAGKSQMLGGVFGGFAGGFAGGLGQVAGKAALA